MKTFQKPNANHPKKGSSIKVEPIRDLAAIKRIKELLANSPRDLALFTLGINTAYRANELLSLTVGHVAGLKAGDRIDLRQSKNSRYRATRLNRVAADAIKAWLAIHPDRCRCAPLFISRKTGQALQVDTVSTMVKGWCLAASLDGNYASHSMRKTWGFHQRTQKGCSVALLMRAYGHASEAQTLDYLGILPDEISRLFDLEL